MTDNVNWYRPGTTPAEPGDYQAALEPWDAPPSTRYHWNGRNWSNPFHAHWADDVKAKIRLERSAFQPFWLEHEKAPH